jgi:thiol:disulfide interchange protein DsbC
MHSYKSVLCATLAFVALSAQAQDFRTELVKKFPDAKGARIEKAWPGYYAVGKDSDGSRKLYIFSDPDCPFCRKLESEIEKLPDTSVYIFPMPFDGLRPNSQVVSRAILCSKNPVASWEAYLNRQELPSEFGATEACVKPIARNLEAAKRLSIYGTPSLIFDDGTLVPGLITCDQIIQLLNKA